LNRRLLLKLIGVLISGYAAAQTGSPAGRHPLRGPGSALDVAVSDIAAAARLGRRYLATLPAGGDHDQLVADIERVLAAAADARAQSDDAAILAAARRAVSDDYLQGRVTDVGGWWLSITEAKLFALAALDSPSLD
jgi:hypothetical protein